MESGEKDDAYWDAHELAEARGEIPSAQEELGDLPKRKQRVKQPAVKFFDAYICYKKGLWDTISDDLRKKYISIARRSAKCRTFTTAETRNNALELLNGLGIPLDSEKSQKKKIAGEPSPREKLYLERSRRKLVDRQKRLLIERGGEFLPLGFFSIVEPGPYVDQAINEVVEEGKLVIVGDEQIKIEKGRLPYDGSERRSRRVVRLGPPLDVESLPPLPASDDEDLI